MTTIILIHTRIIFPFCGHNSFTLRGWICFVIEFPMMGINADPHLNKGDCAAVTESADL